MFVALDKRKKPSIELAKIYAVEQDSNGYPKFLTYDNNQWRWTSAKHFIPCEDERDKFIYDAMKAIQLTNAKIN